ncbi:sensor histidine kinase [Clostridium polynesiense]|uniref:sensor histidine kinase n=1 Tax=Clostridium polynesiense TaxID=1325933 RepID=UPI00058DA9C8|nr:sensor histidine kinase [Clostridium polynesiense]
MKPDVFIPKKIISYIKNLKIRNKVLLSFLILIIFTTTTIGLLSYIRYSDLMERQTINSTRKAFEQANNFISYKLNNVKDISSLLYMNKEIQSILSKSGEDYTLGEQIDDYGRLMDILLSLQNGREVYSIRLYVNNDAMYAESGNKILNSKDVDHEDWYKKAVEGNGSITWRSTYEYDFKEFRTKQNIISIVRTINSGDLYGKQLGVISVDILEQSIYEIVKETGLTTTGKVFLLDDEGIVISSDGKEKLGRNVSIEPYYPHIKGAKEGYSKLKVDNEQAIVYYKQLENTNWRLVAVIPTKEILRNSNEVLRYMIAIMLVIIILAAFIAYMISGSITKRIRQLIKNMKKIEDDNWNVNIVVDSSDEIGVLQSQFKGMVENIKLLIEEKYQAEINKKGAELRALQAQINPHFLYNTLDMICWMAMKYGADDIVNIVNNLAKFFRLSLSGGRDIVSIRDEITHVTMYLDIQMKRFIDEVEGIIEVDEEIMDCATVKLILQPIVENAIIHGIKESETKKGFVKITGREEKGLIILKVQDNGAGISKDILESLLKDDKSKGYGVKNVDQRIKLYFGNEYGLVYESEPGKGTIVTITFPKLIYEDKGKLLNK